MLDFFILANAAINYNTVRSKAHKHENIGLGFWQKFIFFVYFFGGLECVGHSFASVAHLCFLRDVYGIRTQINAVVSWRAGWRAHPSLGLGFWQKFTEVYVAAQTGGLNIFDFFCSP